MATLFKFPFLVSVVMAFLSLLGLYFNQSYFLIVFWYLRSSWFAQYVLTVYTFTCRRLHLAKGQWETHSFLWCWKTENVL